MRLSLPAVLSIIVVDGIALVDVAAFDCVDELEISDAALPADNAPVIFRRGILGTWLTLAMFRRGMNLLITLKILR